MIEARAGACDSFSRDETQIEDTRSGGPGCVAVCRTIATDPPERWSPQGLGRIRGPERADDERSSPRRFVTRRGLRKLGCRVRSKPSEGRT
jgi:hypothetical protein